MACGQGLFFMRYFNELLLSALAIFFAGLAIWMLKHGAPEDGFKWASGLVGTIVGALLMKMQVRDSSQSAAADSQPTQDLTTEGTKEEKA